MANIPFLNNAYFAGTVGIGTDSPNTTLEVNGTLNTGNANGGVWLRESGSKGEILGLNNNGTAYVDLSIRSASGTQLYLDTSGNVGIGTTSPQLRLDVKGSASDTNTFFGVTVEESTLFRPSSDLAGIRFGFNSTDGYMWSAASGGKLHFGTRLAPSNKINMTLDSAGNVGIGVTAPLANLDISNTNGSIYQQWSYDNPGANNYNLQLTETVTSGNVRWVFDQKNAGTVYSDLLVFNQGLIGMGTDEPDGQLNIFKTFSGITSALTLTNNQYGSADNTGSSIRFQGYAAFKPGSSNPRYSEIIGVNGGNSSPKRIDFKFTNDATITTPLSVLQGGNVGIGTTSPGQKLQVEGNSWIKGIYYDTSGDAGASGQVLSSTTTGTTWIDGSAIPGVPAGSGTLNTVPLWTPDGDTLGNSIITQPSTSVVRVSGNSAYFSISDTSAAARNIDIGHWISGQTNIESQGGTLSIGTQSNHNIVFETNGSTKATILSGGNVGIGTTTPGAKLDVVGDVRTSTRYLIATGTANETAAIGYWDGVNFRVESGSAKPMLITSYQGNIKLGISGGTTMTIQSSNVGIGTTSPVSKLDIRGRTDINLGAEGLYFKAGGDTANNGRPLEFTSSSNNGSNGALHTINATSGNGAMSLNTAGVSRIYMDRLGLVGIGTTSPDANLEVESASGGVLRLTSSDTTVLTGESIGKIEFKSNDASTGGNNVMGFIDSVATNVGTRYALSFGTGDAAAAVERMRIDNLGAVRFNDYGAGTLVTDASGNITVSSGGGAGGPYLPLAGGTLTGVLVIGYSDARLRGGDSTGRFIVSNSDTTSYISLNGSSNASPNDISIITDEEILFLTGAGYSEAMRITSTGRVGIGTTNPTANLHVYTSTNSSTIEVGRGPGRSSIKASADADGGYLALDSSGNGLILNHYSSNNVWLVTGGGNVGVGTTGPSQKLHVSGNARITGAYYDSNNSPGTANQVLISTVTGTDWVDGSAIPGVPAGSGTTNYLARWTPDGDTLGIGSVFDNGNVGIGSTNPATKFVVQHTDGGSGIEFSMGANLNYIQSYNRATSDYIALKFDAEDIRFGTNNGTERMRITSAGNVGIGVTGPGAKLEVNGNIKLSSTAGQTATPSYIWLGNDYSSGQTRDKLKIYLYNSGTEQYGFTVGNQSDIQYHSNQEHDFYVANSLKVRINQSGNVGIGTTSPDTSLTIKTGSSAGLAKISSDGNGAAYSANGDVQLYTNNSAYAINFFSANKGSNLMRITDSGNVGIGTTGPGAKLEVAGGSGAIAGTGLAYFNNTDDAFSLVLNNVGTSSQNDRGVFDARVGGSSVFRINNSGNVGIGTTSPTYKLDVVSAGDGLLSLTGATKPAMIFKVGTAVVGGIQAQANTSLNVSAYGTSSLNLQTAGTTPRLTILTGGNVGIGITGPSAKLDVDGVIRSRGGTYAADIDTKTNVGLIIPENDFIYTADGSSYLRKLIGKTSDIITIGEAGTSLIDGINLTPGTSGGYVQIFNNSSIAAKFVDGKLGLGTTSPGQKLDVIGTVRSYASAGNYGQIANGSFQAVGAHGGTFMLDLDNTSTADLVNIKKSGSSRFYIENGGNVGIGTSSPAAQLEIYKINDDPATLRLSSEVQDGDAIAAIISFSNDAGGGGVQGRIENIATEDDTTVFKFYTDNTSSPSMTLFDSGNMTIAGTLTQNSDVRLKENIKPIESALDKVKQMQGVEFNKTNSSTKEIGVVAQEIEKIIPELVLEDKEGIKSVAYGNITAVLIEAIKEQQKQIEELKQQLNK